MHTDIPLARPSEHAEAFRLSEPQANQFAAEILMPRELMRGKCSVAVVTRTFGVSYEAAEHRIEFLLKRGML